MLGWPLSTLSGRFLWSWQRRPGTELGAWGKVLNIFTLLRGPEQPWVAPSGLGDGRNNHPWEPSLSHLLAVGSWISQQNLCQFSLLQHEYWISPFYLPGMLEFPKTIHREVPCNYKILCTCELLVLHMSYPFIFSLFSFSFILLLRGSSSQMLQTFGLGTLNLDWLILEGRDLIWFPLFHQWGFPFLPPSVFLPSMLFC